MRAPIRPIRGRWPAVVERRLRRFVRDDPRIVLDPDVGPEDFSAAMAAFSVGSTIKITGAGRHPHVDQLLLDHVDLAAATIVDLGASDGSTSADLIERLPAFGRYIISDLYLTATVVRVGRRLVILDHGGEVVLVSGPRFVAWPAASGVVRWLYAGVLRRARQGRDPVEQVLLLGPRARALIENDDRVTWAQHDIFRPWQGPQPDVVKVANVLRRGLYFDDERIRVALRQLLADLPEGGHLLMVDNPRARVPARGSLYRREGGRFIRVATTEPPAEIDDLVLAAEEPPAAER